MTRRAGQGPETAALIPVSPFLIGRSRNHGYRVVVAPDLMPGRTALAALRSATGGDPTEPGTVLAREITGLTGGPVTVVYRIVTPLMEELGLRRAGEVEDGEVEDGELEDRGGRPILLVEGFAAKSAGRQLTDLDASTADLEQVRRLTAPAFREFWDLEDDFEMRTVPSFELRPPTAADTPLAIIQAEPWIPPYSEDASEVPPPTRSAPHRSGGAKTAWALGAAAVIAAGTWLAGSTSPKPAPEPISHVTTSATTQQVVCGFLTAGNLSAAYRLTTPAFQQSVTPAAFALAVFGRAAPEIRAGSTMCAAAKPGALVSAASSPTPGASRTTDETGTAAMATTYLPAVHSPSWTSLITLHRQTDGRWLIAVVCGSADRPAATVSEKPGEDSASRTCVG